MSRTVILDNGHGGVIGGVYQTKGKRSPNYSKGILYEGMFNRWVVNGIIQNLDRLGIPYYHISPELTDTSLVERTRRADEIYEQDKTSYILSIHANAGGGRGIEGFTTKGETISDIIGQKFLADMITKLPDTPFRKDTSDGDYDKESNFYILRKPRAPSFLIELGFMDNLADYYELWNKKYLETVIESLTSTIVNLYEN